MADLVELAWKVIPPVLSGVGGVAGTIWKVTKNLEDRLRTLERERLPDTEKWVKAFSEKKYPEDLAALKRLVDDLKQELNSELDKLYEELRGRGKERREERRLQAELTKNYLSLHGRVEQCEKTIHALNNSFTQFAKGQQEQWQEISRALGHIEGWLRAMSSRHSSSAEFKSPTKR